MDSNLEAAVREAISKPTGDILPSDVRELTELDASRRDIVSLEGIENLIHLNQLRLHFSPLSAEAISVQIPALQERGVGVEFDGNVKVNFTDFFQLADAFGGADPNYDFDGTGSVDFTDFFIFAENFDKEERAKLIALAQDHIGLPVAARLEQNYPNPFNSSTAIRYQTTESAQVQLEIFDLTGQKIKSLVDDAQIPGAYEILWDGTNEQGNPVGTGIYLTRLQVGSFTEVRKMLLIK